MRRLGPLDREATRHAVKVAVVAPGLLALGEVVIDDIDVGLFGFFGSFALLVFAQFAGPRRSRVRAYAGLAVAGFPLLALGTVCSHDAWVAGATMAVVGFAILFAGILNGYVAASANAAILLFVLPVMVPAANSEIPDRLLGWALACAIAIPAALLVWPARPQHALRERIARACRALAACLEPPGSDSRAVAERADRAVEAVRDARRRFAATPYRPTGATGPTAALAHLINDVSWIAVLATTTLAAPRRSPFPDQATEVRHASHEALERSAELLEGGRGRQPNLGRLERARTGLGEAFAHELDGEGRANGDLAPGFDEAFRLRFLALAVLQIGAQAMLATGRPALELEGARAEARRAGLGIDTRRWAALRRLIAGYGSTEAVWFRNSARGAVALGLAVLVGQLADVQHGFWVVLGTLSVLRSNALNTGATILRALAGTTIGIVIGALIILGVGTDTALLWAIVPVTVVVGVYAPRAISFAAGQAAFTVVVLTVFDLIQPAGWQVGVVRIEDIAIGCGISIGVGLLFWPHGAAGVVRDSVATAYARASDYLARTAKAALGDAGAGDLDGASEAARESLIRLDDAFRQYLAERSTSRLDIDGLGALVAGATRVVRVADAQRSGTALFKLAPDAEAPAELAGPRQILEEEIAELRDWYEALGASVAIAGEPPEPVVHGPRTEAPVLEWAQQASGVERQHLSRGLAIAWADKLLGTLRHVQPRLADAARSVARGPGPPATDDSAA